MRVVLIVALLLYSLPASAEIITLEPDMFAPGTNLTNASPGVRLWTAMPTHLPDDPLSITPVFARHNPLCDDPSARCDAVTGTQGFSPFSDGEGPLFGNWGGSRDVANCFQSLYSPTYNGPPCSSVFPFRAMLIEFVAPTSFVEIAAAWNFDFPFLVALDSAFNELPLAQTLTTLPSTGQNKGTVSMTSLTANIRYIFAGSVGDAVSLDALRYEAVPEPSTIALLAVGFLILACRRLL